MTRLRKMMLKNSRVENHCACAWLGEDSVLRSDSRGFGVAEASSSAELLRSFGDRWAPFFVTDSPVQDQPDESTLSMGDGPDGLIVSQARDRATIHDLENTSFGSGCGVSSLIE